MNAKRLILIAIAVIVLGAAGATAWLVLSVDRLVAREIERAGSATTGTRVSVGGVKVRLREGSGRIGRLRVANPEGFSSSDALRAEAVTFDLDVDSLARRAPIVLEEVIIAEPTLRLEVAASGQANLQAIAKHAPPSAPKDGSPALLRIDRFVIRDAVVEADATAAGGKKEQVKLEDIVLKNLGGRKGATSDAIAAQIVSAVQKEVTRAVAREGFSRYLEAGRQDAEKKLKDKLKGMFGR